MASQPTPDGIPCPACGSIMTADMNCPNLQCPNHNEESNSAAACPECGGAGKIEHTNETVETCELCGGTGLEPDES